MEKKNRRGWAREIAGVVFASIWCASAWGADVWTGQEVARAREGRMVTEVAVDGTDAFWSEFSQEGGYVKGALREWDRGYLVDVVDEETSMAGTPYWCVGNFEPVPTKDGLYHMALEDRSAWLKWRPVGGEPVTLAEEYKGTCLGEAVVLHGLESGRVYASLSDSVAQSWEEDEAVSYIANTRWGDDKCQRLLDVTGGNIVEVYNGAKDGPSEEEAWEWGWTGNYYATFEFLPNAVWWKADARWAEDEETGEWTESATMVAVLPDGAEEATMLEIPTGNMKGVQEDRWLWTEAREDGERLLVAASPDGTGRMVLSEAVCGASGLSGDGVFWEERTAGGAQLLWKAGDGAAKTLDEAEGNGPLAATEAGGGWFRPMAYRGGVAWLHPGEADGEGVQLAGLRVHLDGKTWGVAENVVCEGGSPVNARLLCWEGEWEIFGGGNAFSAVTCRVTRLAFERIATGGGLELCTWGGEAEGDEPDVLASGYTQGTPVLLAVSAGGAVAAVNFGTLEAPDCRIFLATENEIPSPIAMAGAMEMVPVEANVASLTGEAEREWSWLGPHPGGFELDETGVLTGKASEAGTLYFRVAGKAGDGTVETWVLKMDVSENPNKRPVVDAATPEGGVGNFGGELELTFAVTAHDPEGVALEYRWLLDGTEVGETGTSFTLTREERDTELKTVRCEIADELWNEGNVAVVWTTGVLRVTGVTASGVHSGQMTTLKEEAEATWDEYEVDWYSRATGEIVGSGRTCRVPATADDATFYAVLTTDWGATVTTEDVTAEVDPAPAVGQVYRRTGVPMIGRRCILHAGAWGEEPLECTWTRNGETVGTGRTLRIDALKSSDFGDYVLTASNVHGEAASTAFRLEPAMVGTVVGWETNAPAGAVPETAMEGVVQVAALPYGGVALLRDGQVVAWNAWDTGIADVPEGLTGVEQVAGACAKWNSGIAAAVCSDGTVKTWGTAFEVERDWDDENGCYLVTGTGEYVYWTSEPAGLEDVAQVAVGEDFGIALHGDGRVSIWTDDEWRIESLEEELSSIEDAVRIQVDGYAAVVWHDDGTLSVHGAYMEELETYENVRSVANADERWSYLVVDESGGVHCGENWGNVSEAMGAITNALSVGAMSMARNAEILKEDGGIIEFPLYGSEGTEVATHAFALSAGDQHALALVEAPWQYTVEDGEATVTGANTTAAHLEIPLELDGYLVTGIGSGAFHVDGLESVSISASVTRIGTNPFMGCGALTQILVDGDNPAYVGVDGVLFSKDGKLLVAFPAGRTGTYAIPEGTEVIGEGAFSGAGLETLRVPVAWAGTDKMSAARLPGGCEVVYAGGQLVSFDANGGTCETETYLFVSGETYSPLPVAEREGYAQAGWFTEAEGGTEVTEASFVGEDEKLTLYAHWTANVYAVTLDAQGGSGGMGSVEATFDAEMPAIAVPSKEGCEFGGYFTAPEGEGTAYYTAEGGSARTWDLAGDATLYAYWTVPLAVRVTNVTARQRYPWNGLVDIDFEVSCSYPGTNLYLSVSARDEGTGKAILVRTLKLEGGEFGDELVVKAEDLPEGKGRLVWDARKDAPGTVAEAVTVEVQALAGEGQYMVIDLSAGSGEGATYPVSYLGTVPKGGWGDEFKTTKLVLRRIMPGTFTMGCATNELGYYGFEAVPHKVTITQPFYIGVFEVTQKQWELVMGSNPSYFTGDMRPAETMRYNDIRGSSLGAGWPGSAEVDATSFMGRLRARTDGLAWDLPTEAQWEYACRAGTTTALNSGKDLTGVDECANLAEVGRYDYNMVDGKGGYDADHTVVGSYLPNAWGLYDMHGNVWERCLDWWQERSAFSTVAVNDPAGPKTGSKHVIRGGGWGTTAQFCRSAYRGNNLPTSTSSDVGLRLVCPAGL